VKKNILITGVNGFIGKNLCNYLTSKEFNVYGIDNFYSSKKKDVQLIKSKNLIFKEKSILDKNIFKESPINIDTVVHLAAQTSVARSFKKKEENDKINIKGFENMLLLCAQNDVKNFIFASSCAVYGDSNLNPKSEKYSKLFPKSPYAKSKIENEKFSKSELFNKINIIGLRLFNIYGPLQDSSSEYSAVISRWVSNLMQNKNCKIFGDGNNTRDFCYIDDLCKLMEILIYKKESKGIFNFCTQKPSSLIFLYNIMCKCFEELGIKKKNMSPIFKRKRDGDILSSYGDNSKLYSKFNFKPEIGLKSGIKKILKLNYEKL
tara:strand:+ start:9845 stop:10801 length:957 start_codon:yes stop_codon:yes gene_type:complete